MTHLGTFVSVWLACAPALDAAVAPTLLAAPQEQQPSRPDAESKRPQNGDAAAQIERLRAELAQPGAEGARQRLAAIEHVLSLTDLRAHALLIERIADADDPDGVRAQTLEALVRRLRNPIDPVFGETAPREARLRMASEWKRPDLWAVNQLVNNGQLSLKGLITHAQNFESATAAYETAFGDISCLKMVLDWSAHA